ncbi:peroxiredoxin [Neoconidiobolus thromboides FSU 785]|nr:peroxiredoxin [Neoconidiobolus thromboides FSU 785]
MISQLFRRTVLPTVLQKPLARTFVTTRSHFIPKVQALAPSFQGVAVQDKEFKTIKLTDYKGKFVVLVFYPLDFTFVCPTELLAFSDNIEKFKNLNCEVIGVSTDSHFSHLAWCNQPRNEGGLGDIKIPLLSDKTMEISKNYNVLIEDQGISLRGLFIIDNESKIRVIQVNDLPIGRNVNETLRLIEAIQFTDKHGEVCPANWNKGEDTIKPNVNESKEYFSKQKQ